MFPCTLSSVILLCCPRTLVHPFHNISFIFHTNEKGFLFFNKFLHKIFSCELLLLPKLDKFSHSLITLLPFSKVGSPFLRSISWLRSYPIRMFLYTISSYLVSFRMSLSLSSTSVHLLKIFFCHWPSVLLSKFIMTLSQWIRTVGGDFLVLEVHYGKSQYFSRYVEALWHVLTAHIFNNAFTF